jgi:hypothetical protein
MVQGRSDEVSRLIPVECHESAYNSSNSQHCAQSKRVYKLCSCEKRIKYLRDQASRAAVHHTGTIVSVVPPVQFLSQFLLCVLLVEYTPTSTQPNVRQ